MAAVLVVLPAEGPFASETAPARTINDTARQPSLGRAVAETRPDPEDRLSETRRLPNGMTVIIEPRHIMPLVAIDLWMKTGSADDPKDAPGVAHLLEHMLFKGLPRPKGETLDETIENMGGALEGATSRDWSHLFATVPARDYPQALSRLAEQIARPPLPGDRIELEKGVIADEWATAYADPVRRLTDLLAASAYGAHPYGRPIAGDPASFGSLDRTAVAIASKRVLVGSNLTLVLVGDLDPAVAARRAETAFASIPPGLPRRADLLVAPQKRSDPRSRTVRVSGSKAYLLLGFLGPAAKERDEVVAFDLLYAALGQGETSRLRRALETRGVAHSVSVEFVTQRGPGIFVVAATCEPAQIDRARALIEEEMASIRTRALDPDELASARRRLLSAQAFEGETVAGRAAVLGFHDAVGQPDMADAYAEEVRKSTPEGIRGVASRFFAPDLATWLIAFPTPAKPVSPAPNSPKATPLPDTVPDPAGEPALRLRPTRADG